MTAGDLKIDRDRSLAELIERDGALSPAQAMRVVLHIAQEVAAVHAGGLIHRSIDENHVRVSESKQPRLVDGPGIVEFGGTSANPDACPPELRLPEWIELPGSAAEAAAALRQAGVSISPQRIDVYQLGALLCRLTTGTTVTAYLGSPRIKAGVAAQLQQVIEHTLGFDPASRLQSISEFSRELNDYLASLSGREVSPPKMGTGDTDSRLLAAGDTDTTLGPEKRKLAAAPDQLPFHKLGHYQIVGRIGRGGMGDVYKGYESNLQRDVAIKVLPPELARDESFVRRFYSEATAAARLVHPNILQIYYIGEDAGHHFFAMQHVEGETLAELLGRKGKLTVEEALNVVEQAVAGLAAAHRQGLVHRDVKPSNLLLDRKHRRVLLADFGLVKSTGADDRMTATGIVMGTVDYISPEQGRGVPVDARSDLYSMGVLLYQTLSGQLPFEADSATAMIFQHVYEKPRPLTEIAPHVPPILSRVVDKLLSKAPADRQQTADAVLADISAFRRGAMPPSLITLHPSELVEVEVVDERSRTAIIRAPQFESVVPLPADISEEPPVTDWWTQARNRLFGRIHAIAPQLAERLQNTQQQVDGAVAEYEGRRERLANSLRDAEAARAELHQQMLACRASASTAAHRAISSDPLVAQEQLARQAEHNQQAAELEKSLADQDEEIENVRLRLAQVDATLGKLRSQRDSLNARLKIAAAQQQIALTKPRYSRRIHMILLVGMGVGCVALYVGLKLFTDQLGGSVITGLSRSLLPSSSLEKPTKNQGYEPTTNTASAYQMDILPLNAPTTIPLRQLLGHQGRVRSVAFSPVANMIASASDDTSIRLWDAETGSQLQVLEGTGVRNAIRVIAFSPDGRFLASGEDPLFVTSQPPGVVHESRLVIWNVTSGRPVHQLVEKDRIAALAYDSVDNSFAALHLSPESRGVSLALWNAKTGLSNSLSETFSQPVSAGEFDRALVASPNGERLAFLVGKSQVAIWDLKQQKQLQIFDTDNMLNLSLAFSPNGSALAAGGLMADANATSRGFTSTNSYARVVVWDVDSGKRIGVFNSPELRQTVFPQIKSLAFHPGGASLAVAEGEVVHIWDVLSATVRATLRGHIPFSVAYNRDGSLLVSGGAANRDQEGSSFPYVLVWNGE